MQEPPLLRGLLAALLAGAVQSPAPAQSCPKTFGPLGPGIIPSQSIYYDQYWSVVARAPSGWTFAYCNGSDIYARRFDSNLSPLGNQFLVNSTYQLGTQDEPAIAYNSTDGRFLVAWSERYGYDGSAMGIMGRVYDVNGNPLGTEFVINQITAQSQWRPQISPTTTGGWIVAWSGNSDGDAYFRILDPNGAFLTGDVLVNTYTFDAQVDTSAAQNPDGTIFAAFVDFSSHGGVGTGINLYGRTFDATGHPLQAQEFVLTTFASNGDQRDPHVAADGLGRFFVVWADQLADGSGYGIFERVFNRQGVPLVPEFQVNTTSSGNQTRPGIVVDGFGRSLIAWQDESLGAGIYQVRARRANGQANWIGADFLVNDTPTTGAGIPFPAMDSTASNFVIGWQGPMAGTGVDLFARWFQSVQGPQIYCGAKMNSQGCWAGIWYSGTPSATSPNPFLLTGNNMLNQRLAYLVYGYDSQFTPYQGSQVCLGGPLQRGAILNTGGSTNGNDCSGAPSMDFNARIRSGADPALVSGKTVCARWVYRDQNDPAGYSTGLSSAMRFVICP